MFRNIREINKIGESNLSLMMALYSVNIVTDLGKRLMEAFPECFTDDPNEGPMPLSVLTKLSSHYDGSLPLAVLKKIGQDPFNGMVRSIEVVVPKREVKGRLGWKARIGKEYYIDNEPGRWTVVYNTEAGHRIYKIILVPSGEVDITR